MLRAATTFTRTRATRSFRRHGGGGPGWPLFDKSPIDLAESKLANTNFFSGDMVGIEGWKAKYLAGVLTVCAIQGLIDVVLPPKGHDDHGHGHGHDDHGHGDEEAAEGEPKYGGAFVAKS